ncbi:acetyltransferase [Vibrio mimicus]|nr:acetyltransferase [Vibrio mimicus]
MITVVVFEFSVMRCQPLRRALCGQTLIIKKDFRREIRRCSSLGTNAQRI